MNAFSLLPLIADNDDKSSAFKNRLRKNYRHVRKWANRTLTNCFRIYDRDIKEYPLAIDYYDGRLCIHYFVGAKEGYEPTKELEGEVTEALQDLFGAGPSAIYKRMRVRRAKTEQYEKRDSAEEFFVVQEYGVQFWVNLSDYLDTGLFLDHRETRQLVAKSAKGKSLLNLFAYTGAFSVHAAMQGASFTKTVDMSNTYCEWAENNFLLNKISLKDHAIERADCLTFLDDEYDKGALYDIIVIDPPTLSRSKKMSQMFDIQIDYIPLIEKALELLVEGGILYFSTNARKFVFDENHFPGRVVRDISAKTLPLDFHDTKIHRCWTVK